MFQVNKLLKIWFDMHIKNTRKIFKYISTKSIYQWIIPQQVHQCTQPYHDTPVENKYYQQYFMFQLPVLAYQWWVKMCISLHFPLQILSNFVLHLEAWFLFSVLPKSWMDLLFTTIFFFYKFYKMLYMKQRKNIQKASPVRLLLVAFTLWSIMNTAAPGAAIVRF